MTNTAKIESSVGILLRKLFSIHRLEEIGVWLIGVENETTACL